MAGRGELAWHLAEVDAYVSLGIERGEFKFDVKPPHIERPRTVEGLAAEYYVVHHEAVARITRLQPHDFDREMQYADGQLWSIRNPAMAKAAPCNSPSRSTDALVSSGGVPPALFGRRREETVVAQRR